MNAAPHSPQPVLPPVGAEAEFRAAALAAGMDPDDRWVGGYVDYELAHLVPVLAAYGIVPAGSRALEFGCNVGASGIVLARLGADVTGVDVNPRYVRVAQANIAVHDLADRARAIHVPDTRAMPFADASFDLVIANSVLEYVPIGMLGAVVAEIARVMRPGGQWLICGTASRIAPREIHSRRWLVNYLPRWTDRLAGGERQRGLSPLALRTAITGHFRVEGADRWLMARRAVGSTGAGVRAVDSLARMLGAAPGWLSPNIELLLRRI